MKPLRWLAVPVSIALAVVAGALMLVRWAPVADWQLAVSDAWLLREAGPRLGLRDSSPAVIVVHVDGATVSRLGQVPQVQQDLALYRALLEAGARMVLDTRLLAGDSAETRLLLEGMSATGAGRRLVRDIWPGDTVSPEELERFRPHLAHEVASLTPGTDPVQRQRFYPLLIATAAGVEESMPVLAARAALGLSATQDIVGACREAGILSAWEQSLPSTHRLPPALRGGPSTPQPYAMADRAVPWLSLPSTNPSILPASLWVDYGGVARSPSALSYVDALEGHLPPDSVRDKVIVIGVDTEVIGQGGFEVPISSRRRFSAAEVVLAASQTLVEGRFLVPAPPWLTLCGAVLLALAGALALSGLRPVVGTVLTLALLGVSCSAHVLAFHQGVFLDPVLAPGALVASAVLAGAARFVREERSRRHVQDLFGRYVPRQVVAELVRMPREQALAVGGVKRPITILFADVRGFTTWSDKLPPEEVLVQLNRILSIMVECAFRHEGTVDKFIGDAMLVLFNAPLDQPDHALRAARAAWDMQQAMVGHPSGLSFGIGIHAGEAVVGTVGTAERMEYTAIGASVNLASRLCSTAARGQVAISEEVRVQVQAHFQLEPRPPIKVKGIDRELTTYLVLGPGQPEAK